MRKATADIPAHCGPYLPPRDVLRRLMPEGGGSAAAYTARLHRPSTGAPTMQHPPLVSRYLAAALSPDSALTPA